VGGDVVQVLSAEGFENSELDVIVGERRRHGVATTRMVVRVGEDPGGDPASPQPIVPRGRNGQRSKRHVEVGLNNSPASIRIGSDEPRTPSAARRRHPTELKTGEPLPDSARDFDTSKASAWV
jgi:hypothetical protein